VCLWARSTSTAASATATAEAAAAEASGEVEVTLVIEGHAVRAVVRDEPAVGERAIWLDVEAVGFAGVHIGDIEGLAVGGADDAVRHLKIGSHALELLAVRPEVID
jgi:hypothetical protein